MKRLLGVLFGLLVLIGFTSSQLQAANISLSAIPGSARPTVDADTGELSSSKMTVDVVLAPSNQPELSSLLANLYDSKSASYHQWLGTGEFNSRFAPSNAQIAAVTVPGGSGHLRQRRPIHWLC
jgi:subtilase family serine protease